MIADNSMPIVCPWCGADMTESPPGELIVRGYAVYACGTRLSKYDALYQNTTPCKRSEQWVPIDNMPGDVTKPFVVEMVVTNAEDCLV